MVRLWRTGLLIGAAMAGAPPAQAQSEGQDEGESEALIEDFYRSACSATIGEALRGAQLTLMNAAPSSHPISWGPFFIVGDANTPLLSRTAQAQQLRGAPAMATR